MNNSKFFVAASSAGVKLKPAMPSKKWVMCTLMSPLCSNAFLSIWCKFTKQFGLVRVKVEDRVMSATGMDDGRPSTIARWAVYTLVKHGFKSLTLCSCLCSYRWCPDCHYLCRVWSWHEWCWNQRLCHPVLQVLVQDAKLTAQLEHQVHGTCSAPTFDHADGVGAKTVILNSRHMHLGASNELLMMPGANRKLHTPHQECQMKSRSLWPRWAAWGF